MSLASLHTSDSTKATTISWARREEPTISASRLESWFHVFRAAGMAAWEAMAYARFNQDNSELPMIENAMGVIFPFYN